MTKRGTFQALGDSSVRRAGPRKAVVCGCAAAEQAAVLDLFRSLGLADLGVVFAGSGDLDATVAALLRKRKGYGAGRDSGLPRRVLLSGVSPQEIHLVLDSFGKTGLPRPIFASATEESETWPLRRLVDELGREDEAMQRRAPAPGAGPSVRSVTVGLTVPGTAEAIAWYRRLFAGCRELAPVPGILELQVMPGVWLQLIRGEPAPSKGFVFRYGVDDLAAEHGRVKALGIDASELREIPGVVRVFDFKDPFGNRLCAYQELAG